MFLLSTYSNDFTISCSLCMENKMTEAFSLHFFVRLITSWNMILKHSSAETAVKLVIQIWELSVRGREGIMYFTTSPLSARSFCLHPQIELLQSVSGWWAGASAKLQKWQIHLVDGVVGVLLAIKFCCLLEFILWGMFRQIVMEWYNHWVNHNC